MVVVPGRGGGCRQMARYTTAVCRLCRRSGDKLMLKGNRCFTPKCAFDRRGRRLDNVVYRLGFADSRAQARQLVQHGHFWVNGQRTDIPSCLVKEGDTISWKEGSTKTGYYEQMVQVIESKVIPNWLSLDKEKLVGRVISLPTPDDIEAKFEWQGIVEY